MSLDVTPETAGEVKLYDVSAAEPFPAVTAPAHKPDPNCPTCHGSGVETTTRFPGVTMSRACPVCFPQGA